MIVNAVPEGWEIIYQQAHGVLAAQLAYHLKPALQCPHWVETLIAIANHDNRQRVWRGQDGLTPAGAPADFSLLPVELDQAKALMHAVPFQGAWVTLLTSMHMSYLYDSQRGQQKSTDAFLDEQQILQHQCRKSLHVSKQEAQQAYALLQWCDRLSLILCRNELPADERALEITYGPDGQPYFVKQLQSKVLQVSPWPFAAQQVTVQTECRVLRQLQFENDDALSNALRQASARYKTWEFQNPPASVKK